jgi:hypothetical protein
MKYMFLLFRPAGGWEQAKTVMSSDKKAGFEPGIICKSFGLNRLSDFLGFVSFADGFPSFQSLNKAGFPCQAARCGLLAFHAMA